MLLSCPAKKVTKECGIGEALRKCALPYVPHPPLRHSCVWKETLNSVGLCAQIVEIEKSKGIEFQLPEARMASWNLWGGSSVSSYRATPRRSWIPSAPESRQSHWVLPVGLPTQWGWMSNRPPDTPLPPGASPGMQKARPVRTRFLQQEKRRGKNEKEEIIYFI